MKQKKLLLTFAAALALGLTGCSKNEPAATLAADDANKAAGSAADAAKTAEAGKANEAAKSVEVARIEAPKADEIAKAAEAAKVVESAKVQGLIDKAKSLVAESKFSEALSVLEQLAGQSLSDGQQKLVDGLKEEIQKALVAKTTENAAGAVGGLLKK